MRKIHTMLLAIPLMAAAAGNDYTYRYWFDGATGQLSEHCVEAGTSTIEVNASSLTEGYHMLNFSISGADGVPTALKTTPFIRFSNVGEGQCKILTLIDGKDEKTETVTASNGNINYQLDVADLPLGLHMLSAIVISENGAASNLHTAAFYRAPTPADMRAVTCHYLIDGKKAGTVAADLSTGMALIEIDVDSLSVGLHELSMFISDGSQLNSPIASKMFVKLPGGIGEYRYWLNNDMQSTKHVKLDKPNSSLSIIEMWDIPLLPFRSAAFSVTPNADGSLTLYGCNDLTAMFISKHGQASVFDTRRFIDTRITRRVTPAEIRDLNAGVNLTEKLAIPATNEIIWYKFHAEPGQFFSLRSSQACSIEVWNENGDLILEADGNDATITMTPQIISEGYYYISIHDLVNKSKTFTLYYSNIPRYAIISHSPEKTSNNGVMMMSLNGNGFDELVSLSLKGDGEEFSSSWINVIDKRTAEARFDLENAPFGAYRIHAEFRDSITGKLRLLDDSSLTLEEYKPGSAKVGFIPPNTSGALTYATVTITNTGNQTLLHVPFNLAVEKPAGGCIIHFKDFTPGRNLDPDSCVVYTDNLLNKGIDGGSFAAIIPYLRPYETMTLKLGIQTNPFKGVQLNTYIWCGEAWSEELKRITADDFRISDSDFEQTNQLTLTKLLIMETLRMINSGELKVENTESKQIIKRAPGDNQQQQRPHNRFIPRDEDYSRTRELLEHGIDRSPFSQQGSAAQAVTNVSQATGMAVGGIMIATIRRTHEEQARANGMTMNDGALAPLKQTDDALAKNMPTPAGIIATAFGFGDRYDAVREYERRGASSRTPMPSRRSDLIRRSIDPNDMQGYVNPSGGKHVGIDVNELTYTVEFENDPDLGATASALTVSVENRLDNTIFDLATFKPLKITIGTKTVELPAGHSFIKTIDMRPEINTIAQVELNYDAQTGIARWLLSSLDPFTMEATDYFEQGLLPVNDSISHRGEGMITYSISLKPGLGDATEIANKATIIFDDNDPIDTPEWVNITDYTRPTSTLQVESSDRRTFRFIASGDDTGAGVWSYALFMRRPEQHQWQIISDGIEESTFEFAFDDDLPPMTSFALLATDGAGNVQNNSFMSLKIGDVDRSGVVDANDVLALARHYLGLPVNIEHIVSDINADGSIDVQDAIGAANIYLNQNLDKRGKRTRKSF